MGFRDAKSKGGGFLNDVDGKIVDYIFTDKKVNGEKSDSVYLVPTFRVDGYDKDVTQHMLIGQKEWFNISKDGKTVESVEGGPIRYNVDSKKGYIGGWFFLESLLEHGLDEAELPDLGAGEPLNLEGVVGYRVRFKQYVDEKQTAQRGERKYTNAQGKEISTPQTVVGVSAVYSKEGAGAKTAASKPALAKGAKTANTDAIRDKADAAIQALISAAKGGVLSRAKISVGIINQLGPK